MAAADGGVMVHYASHCYTLLLSLVSVFTCQQKYWLGFTWPKRQSFVLSLSLNTTSLATAWPRGRNIGLSFILCNAGLSRD